MYTIGYLIGYIRVRFALGFEAGTQKARALPKARRLDEECMQFIRAGAIIGAIKHHRQETNSDLKTAKDYIYALRDKAGLAS